jgi:SOS response regulatory protein OraA/RecX
MEYTPAAMQAYRHLSIYPKTVIQTRQYLSKKWYDEQEINAAVNQLKETKVLDDVAYAEAYLYSEVISKWKPLFVTKHKLSQKWIESELLEELVVIHLDDYNAWMKSKLKSLRSQKSMTDEKMKRIKKMVSRWYPYGLVIEIAEHQDGWDR